MNVEITRNLRGFQVYGTEVHTDYGHQVSLFESSGAGKGPVCWLKVQMVDGADMPACNVGVHMTLEQAVEIRDRFDTFINEAQAGNTCEVMAHE
jgi:hypothetical protein